MAPGVPDSPVSETAQSTVAAARVEEIAAGPPAGGGASTWAASVGNRGAMRQKDYHVATSAAKRAINLAWAPPSMSCRGPLVAGVKATSPADRAIRRIPATRHRRLR
jgi:hypothetical protein